MNPSSDPNSTKYPDRVFYGGHWRTPEQIEKKRERHRKHAEKRRTDPEWAERHRESNRKYRCSEKGRETTRRNNERQVYAGGMYLGRGGFTQKEREEILNGTSD